MNKPMTPMQHDAERRAFAAEQRLIEDLSDAVRAAMAATTQAELGKVYETLVGYDLHKDDPSLSVAELRDMVIGYVEEACDDAEIDRTLVGLPADA